MVRGLGRALRFGKEWKVGGTRLREEEVILRRPDRPVPATFVVPEGALEPLPGWVALHGITRPGRNHPTLLRFVRALAASGSAVLVPEVPEWREMLLAPEVATETLREAVLALAGRQETAPGRLGVMGFSFGGPLALLAGMEPALEPHLRVVASFGGYCDMSRTVRFLLTGEHEWKGERFRSDPDPYGRWVAGGNFLPGARGFEGTQDVADALLSLAKAAGDLQVASWEALYDTRKMELERSLPEVHRPLFRAFAPVDGSDIPPEFVEKLVPALSQAALERSPLFDPGSRLSAVRIPIRLIHGRQDRLIPFTETLRLRETLHGHPDVKVFLTSLFSHSQRDGKRRTVRELREQLRFLKLMSVVLGSV